jgi:hypothetical protein
MRRLALALLPFAFTIVVALTLATGISANADVSGVVLTANTASYSGTCPVDIVFIATISGDPGTTFGHKFSGAGFPSSKSLYGFIPDSGSISIDDSISVDATHAGSIERHVEITVFVPAIGGSMFPSKHITSKPVIVSVTCAPSSGSTPLVGATPSPVTTTPAYQSLNGVAVGDAPAPVLARLGLHPPGWAGGSPSGTTPNGEVREFQTDGGNATMMLLFDTTIQVVMVQEVANKTSSIIDPYGIGLGNAVSHLVSVRGNANMVDDSNFDLNPKKNDTIDNDTIWHGLHNPIESDLTYIYGRDDGIRWEYTIKDNQVTSIRVVDCRIAGMCTPAKHS